MEVKLKSITPLAEQTIVEIARVSSSRKDKTEAPEGLINYLIRNKHWSPFEHGSMTIEIETSKVIALQYMRHVSFRFQDFSRRYAVVTDIEPIEFRLQATDNRQSSTTSIGTVFQQEDGSFSISLPELSSTDSMMQSQKQMVWLNEVADHLEQSLLIYNRGLKLGVARETASMILPLAMQTKMFITGSIRSWIHLLDVRDDGHAQKEAQLIAKEVKKIFIEQLPIISKALGYVS